MTRFLRVLRSRTASAAVLAATFLEAQPAGALPPAQAS